MSVTKAVVMFIVSICATIGYAIPVEAPKRSVVSSSLSGGVSYLLYLLIIEMNGSASFGAFLAAFLMGVLGEFFSRRYKMPATIFIMPPLITLVPGGGMYYMMSYLIQDNMDLFLREAVDTFSIAVALSLGIVTSGLFSKSLRSFRRRSLRHNKLYFYESREDKIASERSVEK
ncbi:MAG: threonine/serine exporter family protein [Peptoniphilus sp.]|nr:threonine/serine exporter family protein [Peptoniphilus sp.]MDD7363340.1 threonine/serine exporter family protein [Bacillota bacterium]MDY6044259.1 threonine/serine exporter family protein [Peptoniphilus sp.]